MPAMAPALLPPLGGGAVGVATGIATGLDGCGAGTGAGGGAGGAGTLPVHEWADTLLVALPAVQHRLVRGWDARNVSHMSDAGRTLRGD